MRLCPRWTSAHPRPSHARARARVALQLAQGVPEGKQLDWEAILRPSPAAFADAVLVRGRITVLACGVAAGGVAALHTHTHAPAAQDWFLPHVQPVPEEVDVAALPRVADAVRCARTALRVLNLP